MAIQKPNQLRGDLDEALDDSSKAIIHYFTLNNKTRTFLVEIITKAKRISKGSMRPPVQAIWI